MHWFRCRLTSYLSFKVIIIVKFNSMVEAKKKSTKLNDDRADGVELMKFRNVSQKASPFVNLHKSWDNEDHFKIPHDIQKGIVEVLGFSKPSNIQAVAIPMITKKMDG